MTSIDVNTSQAKGVLVLGVVVLGFGIWGASGEGSATAGDWIAIVLGAAAMLYGLIVLALRASRAD